MKQNDQWIKDEEDLNPKIVDWIKAILVILAILTVVWILSSCNPVRRVLSDPKKLEKVGREWEKQNPCLPGEIKPGKDSIRIDTVFNNDFVFGSDSIKIDSFETTVVKTIIKKVPVYITKTVSRVDTIGDTRRENLLKQDIANREGKITQLEADKKELKKEKKNLWLWLIGSNAFWLLIGFLVVRKRVTAPL